jgi:hypothetical protein
MYWEVFCRRCRFNEQWNEFEGNGKVSCFIGCSFRRTSPRFLYLKCFVYSVDNPSLLTVKAKISDFWTNLDTKFLNVSEGEQKSNSSLPGFFNSILSLASHAFKSHQTFVKQNQLLRKKCSQLGFVATNKGRAEAALDILIVQAQNLLDI